MKLSTFLKQDAFEQSLCIALIGTTVGNYFDGTFDITLYQVNNFYVEAFVHKENQEMYGFRAFESIALLEPYLDKIDLSDIIQYTQV